MKILFLHPNFPGQFLNLATYLGQRKDMEVYFITERQDREIPGVKKMISAKTRELDLHSHRLLKVTEKAVLQGQAAYRTGSILKQNGFYPQVILGHSGWGSTMFMKELYPDAKLLGYFEWFTRAKNSEWDFLGEKNNLLCDFEARNSNIAILSDLFSTDSGLSPTNWQKSRFPQEFQKKINVIHDGIKSDQYVPKADAGFLLPERGINFPAGTELVTYVSRGMDPYRGFPQFMEAVSILQKRRKKCHVVIAGNDNIQAYGGPRPPLGKTWKQYMLENFDYDLQRLHFTGLLMRYEYLKLLQASSAHVYLTVPFVLSWSMLEAMSCGCLVIASNTSPVQEVITDNENGLLVDFFSPANIADRIEEGLEARERSIILRKNARETILSKYTERDMLKQQMNLFNDLM